MNQYQPYWIAFCKAKNIPLDNTCKMLKELPRNPRGLAPRMNWQNNFKNHSTNSK